MLWSTANVAASGNDNQDKDLILSDSRKRGARSAQGAGFGQNLLLIGRRALGDQLTNLPRLSLPLSGLSAYSFDRPFNKLR